MEQKKINLDKNAFDLININQQADINTSKLVNDSETLYKRQIIDLTDKIVKSKKKFVLLAGPSSSGKTTSSMLIQKELKSKNISSFVLSLDNFFINREVTPILPDGNYDYENFDILDIDCFNNFIEDILSNKTAKMPIFDFIDGKRSYYEDINLNPNDIIIIEGIHALNPKLIKGNSEDFYKIYLCLNSNFTEDNRVIIPAKSVRLMRRLIRDVQTRGSSIDYTLQLWKNVCIGEDMYVKPFKCYANYLLDTTHMYEPLLYNTYLKPMLEPFKGNDKIDSLIEILNSCNSLTKDVIPDDSLLWEFLCK